MIIQNYDNLNSDLQIKQALEILEKGLLAANPENFLKKYIKKNQIFVKRKKILLDNFANVYLISLGKAADSMGKFASKNLKIKKGFVILPKLSKSTIKNKKRLAQFASMQLIPVTYTLHQLLNGYQLVTHKIFN